MPQIDNVKRIKTEDFPDKDKETIERIANIYNYFAEQVTNVLNGQIDYTNLNQTIVSINVTFNSSGVPTTSSRFNAPIGSVGHTIINATNTTNSSTGLSGSPFIQLSADGTGSYTITKAFGFVANNRYTVVIEMKY